MSAKSEELLPIDDFDAEELDGSEIEDDDELLFEAAEALKNQSEDDFSDESLDSDDLEKEAEDLEKVEQDASLDILSTTRSLVELGDDPVRLYLKDIGSIELLDVNHEFWLAARMAATSNGSRT